MALLNWGVEHSVGIPAMDDEHRELYEAINELHTAVLRGEEQSLAAQLLAEVVNRTRAHFSSEEEILRATNYPELAAHCLKHQSLIEEIEELVARFEDGDVALNDQSLKFLRYWFNEHIQNDDLSYSAWLKVHGVR